MNCLRSEPEVGGILLDGRFFVFWHIVNWGDSVGGAGRNAGAAIDAFLRIDKELSGFLEARVILLGMDAISGADIDAQ
jgi:hypothetical protein